MDNLLLFILTTATLDSFYTTQQIVVAVLLLSTLKPVQNSLAFFAGVTLTYLACGVAGFMLLDQLNALLKSLFPQLMNMNDASYYQAQFLTGILLFISGPVYILFQKMRGGTARENKIIMGLKRVNRRLSFIFGALITFLGFPASILYLGTLEKLKIAVHSNSEAFLYLVWYNLVYAVPMVIPFILFLIMRGKVENLEQKLHLHVYRWNNILTVLLFGIMGALLIADSSAYFIAGKAIFKGHMI